MCEFCESEGIELNKSNHNGEDILGRQLYFTSNAKDTEIWLDHTVSPEFPFPTINIDSDTYSDGYMYIEVYVKFCPFCGKEIKKTVR